MTKGNGKSDGYMGFDQTVELDQPEAKAIVLNLMQFVQGVASALDLLNTHTEYHCHQIAALQAEVKALKKGLSTPAETVAVGETNG